MSQAAKIKWRLDDGQIEVVDDRVAEILRGKTLTERVQMVLNCDRLVRARIAGQIMTDHPDWTESEVRAAVAGRISGGRTRRG